MTTWLVHILPFVEQSSVYNQYNRKLNYNNAANLPVGNLQVPIFYCSAVAPNRTGNSSEASGGTLNLSTHYYGNMGPTGTGSTGSKTITYGEGGSNNSHFSKDGVLGQDTHVLLTEIIDGTSNTLMAAERSQIEPGGTNSYRSWIRGCNGGCGASKNVTNPINSANYNGSNNFNDISFGSTHTGGANFVLADGSVRFISQTIDMNVYKAAASRNSGEALPLP